MTREQFQFFWTSKYPDTIPISHYFRHDYPDRWFRIHSLPQSKRYAENDEEWTILLDRQNKIISDLIGENAKIILITGDYNLGEPALFITDEEEVFKPYKFIQIENIDLNKINPAEYDAHQIYRPAFAETTWASNTHNNLLKQIADDNARAFIVSVDKGVIIAPYDGGVDLILKDERTKDIYKQKYKDWLSARPDGL